MAALQNTSKPDRSTPRRRHAGHPLLIATSVLTASLWASAAPAIAAPPDPPGQPPPGGAAPAAGEAPQVSETGVLETGSLAPELRGDPAQYRGRPIPTTAGQALSWIPRVLFFPVFLVTELGFRRPVYAAAEWADRNYVVPIIEDALHPTPDISWSPTLSLDLGAITFVGAKARFQNVGVPGHEVKVAAAFGGIDALHFKLRDRWQLGSSAYAGIRGEYLSRWDRPFHGFGPYSGTYRTNFSQARGDGFVFAGFEHGNHLRLELSEGFRHERTDAGGAPSIETRFDPADLPGFGELDLAIAMLDVKLDTRRIPEENGGVRFVGNATYARDVLVAERSFVTAEADLEGAVEVSYPDRVLAARVYAMDTFPLGEEEVPFTHQATLGSQNHHAFIAGRFRGESALMAEARYRYPIAYFVDAQWTASVGNVFSRDFADFKPEALTGSFGVGLRTRRTDFTTLEIMFAVGTTRFDERFGVDSLRVYFGTTEGL